MHGIQVNSQRAQAPGSRPDDRAGVTGLRHPGACAPWLYDTNGRQLAAPRA